MKEFNISKVADLKRATLMENLTPLQVFLIGFSTVAEPLFCRTPPSGCLYALLERKRMKEIKKCVFIVLSLTLLCGIAKFIRENTNKLRTFQPQK